MVRRFGKLVGGMLAHRLRDTREDAELIRLLDWLLPLLMNGKVRVTGSAP